MSGVTPAVALLAFNRPEATRRTFEAIRAAAPPKLFVVVDGPRADRPGEAELCQAVRDVVADVDWDCEVHRIFREENLGCSASIELGLDEVFRQVPEAIVVEDDCVPHPTFFRFCAELLDRYRDDPVVAHIAGSAIDTPPELFKGASYAFSSVAAAWGWATWADRWHEHRARLPRSWDDGSPMIPGLADDPALALDRHADLVTTGLTWHASQLAQAEDPRGPGLVWDFLWAHFVMGTRRLAVTPAVNMVENVGFGEGATHAHNEGLLPPAEPMPFPLVHPEGRAVDRAIALEIEFDALWIPVAPSVRAVRRRLPHGAVRTRVLRALTTAWIIRRRAALIAALKRRRARHAVG